MRVSRNVMLPLKIEKGGLKVSFLDNWFRKKSIVGKAAKPLSSAQQAALFTPVHLLEFLSLSVDFGLKGVASPSTDGGIIVTQPFP